MKRRYLRTLSTTTALVMLLAVGSAADAAGNNCQRAYRFCFDAYYVCLNAGNPESECHLELDACILRNGCNILP
jgi:hypothetical protein